MTDISIIKRSVITERSVSMSEARKYVFVIAPSATKNEVKKAIKELYKVEVAGVNIVNLPGKTKRFRNTKVKKSGIKKAIVTLKEGHKIDIGR